MILLPALLKEVLAVEHLGFQVAPGLSSASEEQLALVKNESPRVVFLTDNDKSGRILYQKVIAAGIPATLVHSLPKIDESDTVLEDFLELRSYVCAINEEFRRSHGDGGKIKEAEIPRTGRVIALDQWCQTKGISPPNKRAIGLSHAGGAPREKSSGAGDQGYTEDTVRNDPGEPPILVSCRYCQVEANGRF